MLVGIWGHGRSVHTPEWERLVWGNPDKQRLGLLPTMVLTALNEGLSRVVTLGVGTGASLMPDGRFEAEAARDLLIEGKAELLWFDSIREHPELRHPMGQGRLDRLLKDVIVDTVAQNTAEEIAQASHHFDAFGITKIVAVASGDYAPQCVAEHVKARSSGIIPPHQHWSMAADDMPL